MFSGVGSGGPRDNPRTEGSSTNSMPRGGSSSSAGSAGSVLVPATPRESRIWEDVVEAPPLGGASVRLSRAMGKGGGSQVTVLISNEFSCGLWCWSRRVDMVAKMNANRYDALPRERKAKPAQIDCGNGYQQSSKMEGSPGNLHVHQARPRFVIRMECFSVPLGGEKLRVSRLHKSIDGGMQLIQPVYLLRVY
jgi:hypothetical protein